MPEKQRRPQDKPLRGGVGAVYRRAILPCQMRNELKFRFFVSSFAIAVWSEPKLCVNASADEPYGATAGPSRTGKGDFRLCQTERGQFARGFRASPIRREFGDDRVFFGHRHS